MSEGETELEFENARVFLGQWFGVELAFLDCNRVPNGPARVDCAGTCAGDLVYDCAGTCGGVKYVDSCNICGGPDTCAGNVTEREWPSRGNSFDADGNCWSSMSNDC